MCLSLLPGTSSFTAFAGGAFLEAIYFDHNRSNGYGGATDGYLEKDSGGAVHFDVSGGKSMSENCTISSVWLVDADSRAEKYNLLSSAYGGTNECKVYSPFTVSETGETIYPLEIWIHGLTIPNAAAGDYRLRVVTSTGTFYSDEYSDPYISTDGIVHIVEEGEAPDVVQIPLEITTLSLPRGRVGEVYSAMLTASRSATWELAEGSSLPEGLTLNESGLLSGTPGKSGSFNVTIKAEDDYGNTTEKTFSLKVILKQLSGSWAASLTPANPCSGMESEYDFSIRPSMDIIPSSMSSLTVTLPKNVLTVDSDLENLTPGGVTYSIEQGDGTVIFSFNGETEVTKEDGIAFTLTNVRNPDAYSVSAYVRSDNWESATVACRMDQTSASASLVDPKGMLVTIEDWESLKYMPLKRLIVTWEEEGENKSATHGFSDEGSSFRDVNIAFGTPYTVTLQVRDSLYNWHTYASHSGTGDGQGNLVILRANNPDDSEKISPYRLEKTLGSEEVTEEMDYSIFPALYKNGAYLDYSFYNDIQTYWFTDADADKGGFTANTNRNFASDSKLKDYDRDGASVTVDKNNGLITVDYPLLSRDASLSGTVKDSGDAGIPYASLLSSQTVNGVTNTLNIVTDEKGAYTIPGLYDGKEVNLAVWADGYEEKNISVTPGGSDQEISLYASKCITVLIGDGKSVTNPSFTVSKGSNGKSYSFAGGTSFRLDLPSDWETADNTEYTVSMKSDDAQGPASGTAVFSEGIASVTLNPVRLGTLDWSALEGTGYYVLLFKENGSLLGGYPVSDRQRSVPEGTYTVCLSSSSYSTIADCPAESRGSFTVTAGETKEVSGLTLPSVTLDVVGGVTGPATAPGGGLYKLSAILESEINGSDNSTFAGFTVSLSDNSTLQGMTVNGSYVGLSSGAGYWVTIDKDNYNAVDWTFPLECTLYLRQNAATGSSQNVELKADYNSVNYGSRSVSLGSVSTRSVPSLTLYAPARIGAQLVDAKINGVKSQSWQPEAFAFSGTGVKNQDVRIYDNEQLIAIVRADEKGSFSGTAYPASTYSDHLIRAEQQSGGDTLSVTKELLYEPSGPVLTGLSLITNGYRRWQLPINGAPGAYTATPTMVYQYEAEIRNEEQLDEITVQNPAAESSDDQETLTAKVFFRVFSAGGETLLPAVKEGNVWKSEEKSFGGNYPVGVEVLYQAKESEHEASVLIQDATIPENERTVTVDYNYILYNKDGSNTKVEAASQTELYELMGLDPKDDGNVAPDWDLGYPEWNEDNPASNGWALPPAPSSDELEAEQASESFESLETGGSGSANVVLLSEGVESSVTDGFEEEEARLLSDSKSLSDLFTNIANSVNQGLGVGNDLVDENGRVTEISTLNGQQAVSNGANNLTMEVRTWIDQPTWTSSGVKWRVEELRGKGYKAMSASYNYNQYLYFTGNYYYDKYGRPSSLTRTVPALGGVDQTEPNPDMYSRTTGQMIGSSLKVEYIYSVKEGKWMRSQTAMIPPGASSPIHLAANQIPDATTPPYRYTPVSQMSEDSDDSDMEAGALMAEDSPFTEEESRVYAVLAEGATNRTGGMSWGVKLENVQNSTYAGMAISGTGYLGAKWVGASKKLHKLTLGDKDKMVKIGKKFEIAQGEYSLSMEESIVTGVAWGEGWIPQGQETKFGNIGGIREQLLANYKYYSNLEDNPAYSYRASRGKQDTKKLLEALGDVEYAIEMAGVQDAFTNNVTTQLSFASGFIGLFGGPIGAEASFAIDLYSTFLKAANDTNNAEVKAAVERFLSQVDSYKASDAESKKKMKEAEQANKDYNNEMGFPIYDIDEDVFNDPFDPNYKPPQTAQTTPVHDPSGIIYEAVIENPVQGASVTLWRYDEAGDMERHDDSAYLGQQNPLASDESGYYHWDVPEGKWYVTAEKAGYSAGSSQEDRAATKSFNITGRGSVNFLPVLPPQLDVNIPLTDPTAPVVEEVEFSDEGIYVTFSKYMADTVGEGVNEAESVLNRDNYTLLEWGGAPFTAFTVEAVEQGHTPANRNGETGTYTRKVLLRPDSGTFPAGHRLTLIVAGTVLSYAGTAIGADFVRTGTTGGIQMDDIVPSGLTVSVLVSCEVDDATALCSVFRENGQMLAVYSIPLDKGDRQKLEFRIRQSDYSYVQIHVLDSELVPLYSSRRIRADG